MTNKVRIDRELLLSKISRAIRFIPSKQIIPMMESFRLTIENGIMEIVATDSNCEIKLTLAVDSKENFAICVPAALFLKTVSLFRENEVTITQKSDNKIELKSGKSKYNITLDCFAKDFHTMKFDTPIYEITMHQFSLKEGLKRVEKFIDEKHPNANMTAMNISEVNNKITFIGLTMPLFCRAAYSPISINRWAPVNLLPEITNKVIALLGDKGEVGIVHTNDKVRFFTERSANDFFEVTAVTSNAKFPPAEKYLSKRPEDHLTIDTQELLHAVKRLELYASIGSEPMVHISNALDPQNLRLVTIDDLGSKDGEEIISILNPSQLIIDKTMANKSLIKVLSSVDNGEINMFFNPGVGEPSYIIPKVQTEEENIYTFLIGSIKP